VKSLLQEEPVDDLWNAPFMVFAATALRIGRERSLWRHMVSDAALFGRTVFI